MVEKVIGCRVSTVIYPSTILHSTCSLTWIVYGLKINHIVIFFCLKWFLITFQLFFTQSCIYKIPSKISIYGRIISLKTLVKNNRFRKHLVLGPYNNFSSDCKELWVALSLELVIY